jgi:TolB protein
VTGRFRIGVAAFALGLAPIGAPSEIAAQAVVKLGIERSASAKPTITVLAIRGDRNDSIATMLTRDLDYSDRFAASAALMAAPSSPGGDYGAWQAGGLTYVVQATLLPSGWMRVALHDVQRRALARTQDFPLAPAVGSASWRYDVHRVADAIDEWVTSEPGIASTRIAFERGGRVWVVDSDGANPHPVTSAGFSSVWTSNGRGLIYSTVDDRLPGIYYSDLSTGQTKALTAPGADHDMTPALSADGLMLAFARMSEHGTYLYRLPMGAASERAVRVSVGRGTISSQPTFNPDATRMIFASDRAGRIQLYLSDAVGTDVEPLLSASPDGMGDQTAPDWSPDGRHIAFQAQVAGTFQIVLTDLHERKPRVLTTEGRNDSPSWAPDSRHLVVTSQRSGERQLWIVDAETGRARQLTRGAESRLAAWSSRLTAMP